MRLLAGLKLSTEFPSEANACAFLAFRVLIMQDGRRSRRLMCGDQPAADGSKAGSSP